MTQTRDETLPEGRWEFDAEVTTAFEDMLARSIPDYETMRRLVTDLGMAFRQPDTLITDLGCSRGDALAPFVDRYGTENTYVGVDVSEPMLTAAKHRFRGNPTVHIGHADLRDEYPWRWMGAGYEEMTGTIGYPLNSVTLAVLTLQFVPIEYRQVILDHAHDSTAPGGCLILVEKVLGVDGYMQRVLVDHYHRLKLDNGYTVEQVERKRLSLEGVLVPVSAPENARMLERAGFAHVECVWRFLNFAMWLAVR